MTSYFLFHCTMLFSPGQPSSPINFENIWASLTVKRLSALWVLYIYLFHFILCLVWLSNQRNKKKMAGGGLGNQCGLYNKATLVTSDCIPTVPISLSKNRFLTPIDWVWWAADISPQFTLWLWIETSKNVPFQIGRRHMLPKTTFTRQCRSSKKRLQEEL